MQTYFVYIPFVDTNNTKNGLAKLNISVEVSTGVGYITFVCNVSGPFTDLLGCIVIVHNNNYSSMIVNKIPREVSTRSVNVISGKTYPYTVLPWKRSGHLDSITDSEVPVMKGSLFVPNHPPGIIAIIYNSGFVYCTGVIYYFYSFWNNDCHNNSWS